MIMYNVLPVKQFSHLEFFLYDCKRTACPVPLPPWSVLELLFHTREEKFHKSAPWEDRRTLLDPCKGHPSFLCELSWDLLSAVSCPTKQPDHRHHLRKIHFPFCCLSTTPNLHSHDDKLHAACIGHISHQLECPTYSIVHFVDRSRVNSRPFDDTQSTLMDSLARVCRVACLDSPFPIHKSWMTCQKCCVSESACHHMWLRA